RRYAASRIGCRRPWYEGAAGFAMIRAAGRRICTGVSRMSSLFDLTGAVAIVTGASRGIGRAIAERLAEHGAKVVVSSRNLDACEEVVDAIRKQGGEAFAHACNIGRKEQLRSLVDATLEKWGAVDTLVCNAAVNPYYGPSI